MAFAIPKNIPTNPWQIASQLAGKVPGLLKWPIVNRTIGILGQTPSWDLNKNYSPNEDFRKKHEGELKGIGYYLRRYALTWGNILGVAGIVTAFVTGRMATANPEQTNLRMSGLNALSKLLALVGIGGSIYSEYNKINVLTKLGPDAYSIAASESILNNGLLERADNKELKANAEKTTLRFDSDTQKAVDNYGNRAQGKLKVFLVGPPNTGKSQAMDLICGKIIQREERLKKEGKEVIVEKLNGQEIIEGILGKEQAKDSLVDFLGQMSGNAETTQILSVFQGRGIKTLLNVIKRAKIAAKDAAEHGKRYVFVFDEVDKLFILAKGGEGNTTNNEILGMIATQLKELNDDKNLDVLYAANASPAEFLGLSADKPGDAKTSAVAGLYNDLEKTMKLRIDIPDFHTQANIIATYLLQLPKELKVAPERLFSQEINEVIKDKSGKEREQALANYIYDKIYKDLESVNLESVDDLVTKWDDKCLEKNLYLNKVAFGEFSGGAIREVINSLASDTELVKDGKLLGGANVGIDLITKVIKKKLDLPEYLAVVNVQRKKLVEEQERQKIAAEQARRREEEAVPSGLRVAISDLLALNDADLLASYRDPEARELIDRVLEKIDTAQTKELLGRIARLTIKRTS